MSLLAIKGAPKAVNRALGKDWPIAGKAEEKALLDVFHSRRWCRAGMAPNDSKVFAFESAWAEYQQAAYCVAVNGGTTALEVALKTAGVQPGDEVLVPALTFHASATCIAGVNAFPTFVDVDPETFNISPKAAEAAITRRTSAILVVHNGGYPANLDALKRLARQRGLSLIEDCAHAHGSEWKGRRVGALGTIGAFSFQLGKTLPAGEGGAVLTNQKELAERMFNYQHCGQVQGRPFPCPSFTGSNLRMTEFQGALLLAQLKKLDAQTERREKNTAYLAEGMKDIPGVRAIRRDKRVTRWGFYFWNFHYEQKKFEDLHRDRFLEALQAEGVPVGVGAHGQPIYRYPMFQRKDFASACARVPSAKVDYSKTHCEVAEHLFANVACSITHRAFLGPKSDMDLILRALRKVRKHAGELK